MHCIGIAQTAFTFGPRPAASVFLLQRMLRSFEKMSGTTGRDLYCVGDRRMCHLGGEQSVLVHVGQNGSRNGRHGLWLNVSTMAIGFLPPEQTLGPLIESDSASEKAARGYIGAIRDSIAGALGHALPGR